MDRCPCCGSLDQSVDPLVAASDVLVLRALELIGKRIVRGDQFVGGDRSRFARMADRPFYEAHLLWQPDPRQVDKALASAWDSVDLVLAEHGCCGATPEQVTRVLDRYVRDLVTTMKGHSVDELRMRLGAYLGMPA